VRARNEAELRVASLRKLVGNAAQLPAYFRELVREQFAEAGITFLAETMSGEQTFATPVVLPGGGKDHPPRVEIVEVEAPSAVRVRAAESLLGIAIPHQSGLVGANDGQLTGVMLIPALDPESTPGDEHGRKVIEEEVGFEESRREDRDEAPGPLEEVIDAQVVADVLARRRARSVAGNGHSPRGATNGS
jgi:hypothetical protein